MQLRLLNVAVDGGDLRVLLWGTGKRVAVAVHGITASAWRGRRSRAICRPTGRWPLLTCAVVVTAATCPARTAWTGTPATWRRCCAISADGRCSPGIRWARTSRCSPATRTRNWCAGSSWWTAGCPLPVPEGIDLDAALDATLGPAVARLRADVPSTEAYLDFWRAHPALAGHWTADVEAYAATTWPASPGSCGRASSEEAVRTDSREVMAEKPFADALGRLTQADAAADRAGRDVRRAAAADPARGRGGVGRTCPGAAAAGRARG